MVAILVSDGKKRTFRLQLITTIVICALIATALIYNTIDVFDIKLITNPVGVYIGNFGKVLYEREERVEGPNQFRTVPITSEGNVWLGYANEEREIYYCLHGTKLYSDIFYEKTPSGKIIRSNVENVKLCAELVFKEEDVFGGAKIKGYVNIYRQDYYANVGTCWVEINISTSASHFTVSVEKIEFYTVFFGYSTDGVKAQTLVFVREMYESFDKFLVENEFNEFHRSN